MIAAPGHTDSAPRPARPSAGRTLRLLVVEDDLLHARLLKANVERPGRVDVELEFTQAKLDGVWIVGQAVEIFETSMAL